MDASVTQKTPAVSRNRLSARKSAKWLFLAVAVLVAGVFGYRYWHHSQLYVSTDNAYVNANMVEVAAQISGAVTRVYVRDNQPVKPGEPLFDIDPGPYRVALEKAQAQLRLAEQQVSQQSAAVQAAEAQVDQRRAELQNARNNNAREQKLVRQGFFSRQGSEAARTQEATAAAALQAALANLEQARSALGTVGDQNANVQAARAAVAQAEIDLQRTRVASPTQGYVANLSLRPGNTVQPGTPLFSIIGSQEFWVDANFKETELERVRAGEPATITVDMYPDHPFHGVVESVSGGAGTAFSLLPPQNATGNWVKVTQRVPVRVHVTDPDPRYPLRVGTTASVELAARDMPQTSGQ